MAPLTNREIIAAKRPLAVMAGHTTLGASNGVMVERLRHGNLSSLRHAGSDLMAFSACDLLMLCMTKADSECLSELRCPRIAT